MEERGANSIGHNGNLECGSGTRRRPKRKGLCRGTDAEVGKKEVGKVGFIEVGPVVVPKERDYAAAQMRKSYGAGNVRHTSCAGLKKNHSAINPMSSTNIINL